MPLPIESVVSAAPSPVATKPDGVAFAEVSPDFRFCINTHCHCGAVLLPPVDLLLSRWWCVCWPRGNGDSLAALRRAVSGMAGGTLWLDPALMLFTLPEYHHDIHQPLVAGSLVSLARWIAALVLVLFIRAPRRCGAIQSAAPYIWSSYHRAFFLGHGCPARPALRRKPLQRCDLAALCDDSGLGADSGAYMFGKLFGKHKLAPKVSPVKRQGFIGGLFTAAIISWGYGVWANLDIAPSILLVCSIFAALASVLGDLTESMFKREAGIKDSGHLIPGMAGYWIALTA